MRQPFTAGFRDGTRSTVMVVEPFGGVTLGDHDGAMDPFHPRMVEKIMKEVSIELT